jgi:hypothetical protein
VAATSRGRQLTEAHRQQQLDARDNFLAEFLALWALLDTDNLDETGQGWVRAVTALIKSYRQLSAEITTAYYWAFRAAELGETGPRIPDLSVPGRAGTVGTPVEDVTSRPPMAPPPAAPRTGRPPRNAQTRRIERDARRTRRDAARELERFVDDSGIRWDFDESVFERRGRDRSTRIEIPEIDWEERDRAMEISLNIVGPVGQKSKIKRGKTPQEARDASFVESSGVATRHVLTGGRKSLLTLLQRDDRAQRWIRVTDGDPCAFCAMLASRGPVYLSEDSAGFKAHDHCACTAEPVYHSNAPWPGRADEFRKLWDQYIKGRYSGQAAIRAWEKLYRDLQKQRRSEVA